MPDSDQFGSFGKDLIHPQSRYLPWLIQRYGLKVIGSS
jgi:hypothetical protein